MYQKDDQVTYNGGSCACHCGKIHHQLTRYQTYTIYHASEPTPCHCGKNCQKITLKNLSGQQFLLVYRSCIFNPAKETVNIPGIGEITLTPRKAIVS